LYSSYFKQDTLTRWSETYGEKYEA
jgi:hypothetical protein